MPFLRPFPIFVLAVALLASCGPSATTGADESRVKGASKGKATARPGAGGSQAGGGAATGTGTGTGGPATGGTGAVKAGFFGRLVGLDSKAAVAVTVRAYKLDEQGTGVLGVLTAASAYSLAQAAAPASVPLETKTKADGTFAFDVPDGTRLVIEAEQKPDVKAIGTLVAQPDAGVVLRLAKTGTLQGKVTATGVPTIKDFSGAEVFITGTPYSAKADAQGNFRLENVPVGDYKLSAARADLGDGQVPAVTVAAAQTATTTVDLGVIIPKITALEPAAAGPGASIQIAGTGFANKRGTPFTVTLANNAVADAARTDEGTITFVVPATATSGDVVVTLGAIASAPSKLTVLKSLSIQANPKELATGASHPFVATALDAAGQPVATVPAIWTASGSAFADSSGLITAGDAEGQATVEATSGTIKDTLIVKIIKAPATAAPVQASPSPATP